LPPGLLRRPRQVHLLLGLLQVDHGGLAGRPDDQAPRALPFDGRILTGAGRQQGHRDSAGGPAVGPQARSSPKPSRRPRLLCAAWEAANAGDQAAFDKAFPETVQQFLANPEGGKPYQCVAIDQSSAGLIAERRGLKLPPLSEKLQAAVVTRSYAGLEP
jgi:hypothetical protein